MRTRIIRRIFNSWVGAIRQHKSFADFGESDLSTSTMFSVNSRSCEKHLVTVSCHLMIFPTIRNWENHSDHDGIFSLDDFNILGLVEIIVKICPSGDDAAPTPGSFFPALHLKPCTLHRVHFFFFFTYHP